MPEKEKNQDGFHDVHEDAQVFQVDFEFLEHLQKLLDADHAEQSENGDSYDTRVPEAIEAEGYVKWQQSK